MAAIARGRCRRIFPAGSGREPYPPAVAQSIAKQLRNERLLASDIIERVKDEGRKRGLLPREGGVKADEKSKQAVAGGKEGTD